MQHYKKRNPPWIKAYAELLDDEHFESLSDECKLIYFCLTLFASRKNNRIKWDTEWLSRKLPIVNGVADGHIKELISAGFLETYEDDSTMLALSYQDATPETETEQSKAEESIQEKTLNSFTLQQVENEGFKVGISDSECKVFFDHYNSQGWLKGNGLLVTSLSSQLANWRNNGYKFPDRPKPEQSQDDRMLKQWEHRMGDFVRTGDIETVKTELEHNLKNPAFKEWVIGQRPELKEAV